MRLSICLATYNGSKFIDEQLISIINQLGDADEILVADDGSKDDTVSRILRFGNRVRIISTDRIGGVVANFERVLAAANGDGLVLCDQDDVWLPGRLDLIRSSLMRCQLVILNGQFVDEKLVPRGKTVFQELNVRSGFWSNLAKNSYIGCCMALRRDLADSVLPFPAGVPWHDWYIGLAAELLGDVERIESITMLYRRHTSNFSPTGEKSRNSLLHMIYIRLAVFRAVLIAISSRRTKKLRLNFFKMP